MSLRSIFVVILALVTASRLFGADLAGKWTASFDTQIGEQHYTYDFKVTGDTVTGTAKSDNGEVQIKEGKLNGDTVTFVENLNFQGMELRIVYTGKISGDEIKFARVVADTFNENLVAKRAK